MGHPLGMAHPLDGVRAAPEVKAELRAIGGWLQETVRPMGGMWRHVGARMGECLEEQQGGRPCAPCPACQLVRDSLRLLALTKNARAR